MLRSKFFVIFISIFLGLSIFAQDSIYNLPLGDTAYCYDQRGLDMGKIYDAQRDVTATWDEMIHDLSQTQVILLGESHTNYAQHKMQAQIISDLVRLGKRVIIGMEFFQRDQNELLEVWRNQKLTEDEFLLQSDWFQQVGFNYRYYQPILEQAREHKLPTYGLNIPRTIVHKVARKGLQSLDEKERSLFPTVDTNNIQHRYLIQRIFGGMAISSPEAFQKMYSAQCVWDVAMAHSIAQNMQQLENKDSIMVVIVGSGHVIYNLGIPYRLPNTIAYKSVVMHEIADIQEQTISPHFAGTQPQSIVARGLAHWILGTSNSVREEFPTIGVKMNFVENKIILNVSGKSLAEEKLGWKKDDVLLELNEKACLTILDAQKIIMNLNWNEKLIWKIQRQEQVLQGEYIFVQCQK